MIAGNGVGNRVGVKIESRVGGIGMIAGSDVGVKIRSGGTIGSETGGISRIIGSCIDSAVGVKIGGNAVSSIGLAE